MFASEQPTTTNEQWRTTSSGIAHGQRPKGVKINDASGRFLPASCLPFLPPFHSPARLSVCLSVFVCQSLPLAAPLLSFPAQSEHKATSLPDCDLRLGPAIAQPAPPVSQTTRTRHSTIQRETSSGPGRTKIERSHTICSLHFYCLKNTCKTTI